MDDSNYKKEKDFSIAYLGIVLLVSIVCGKVILNSMDKYLSTEYPVQVYALIEQKHDNQEEIISPVTDTSDWRVFSSGRYDFRFRYPEDIFDIEVVSEEEILLKYKDGILDDITIRVRTDVSSRQDYVTEKAREMISILPLTGMSEGIMFSYQFEQFDLDHVVFIEDGYTFEMLGLLGLSEGSYMVHFLAKQQTPLVENVFRTFKHRPTPLG